MFSEMLETLPPPSDKATLVEHVLGPSKPEHRR